MALTGSVRLATSNVPAYFLEESEGDLLVTTSTSSQRILLGNSAGCNALLSLTSNAANVGGTINAPDVSTNYIQTTDIYLTTYDPRLSNTLPVVAPRYEADTFTTALAAYASNTACFACNAALTSGAGAHASNALPALNDTASFASNAGAHGSNAGAYASNLGPAVAYASNAATTASNLIPAVTYASNTASATSNWARLRGGSNLAFSYEVTLSNTTTVRGPILPDVDATYDLGGSNHRFRSLYVSGSTIYLGGTALSADVVSGAVSLTNTATSGLARLVIDEIQVGSASEGSNSMLLRLDPVSKAVQFVPATTSNGGLVEQPASSATIDSNLPDRVTFASNTGASAAITAAWASNTAASGSNLAPVLAAASNAAIFSSNAAIFSSNAAAWGSNRAAFASNAGAFGSNLSPAVTAASNAAIFSSNAAAWGSNRAAFASNAGAFGSNLAPAVTAASNAAVFGSNAARFASNAGVFSSNTASYASNTAVAAQAAALVGSNYGLVLSNMSVATGSLAVATETVLQETVLQGLITACNGLISTRNVPGSNAVLCTLMNSGSGAGAQAMLDFKTYGASVTPGARVACLDKGYGGILTLSTKPSGTDAQSNAAVVERVRVTDAGYVGVGTSNPSAPLEVSGSNASGVSVMAQYDIVASSDARLKTDLRVVDTALERLNGICGYTFARAGEGGAAPRFAGLVAQEVQAVFPEVVHEGAGGMLSVAYGNFSALIVQAIKELQAQVLALHGAVEDLSRQG